MKLKVIKIEENDKPREVLVRLSDFELQIGYASWQTGLKEYFELYIIILSFYEPDPVKAWQLLEKILYERTEKCRYKEFSGFVRAMKKSKLYPFIMIRSFGIDLNKIPIPDAK